MKALATTGSNNNLSPINIWIRHRSICYLTGRGVLYGVDAEIYPLKATAPSKFAVYADDKPHPRIAICDSDLTVLANEAFNYVLIGKRMLTGPNTKKNLQDAVRKLQTGGHLIVVSDVALNNLVASTGSWLLKDTYNKFDLVLQIYKKLKGKHGITERKSSGKPRACIVRYGALGDMIMLTPLIHRLYDDGYEVTLNITPYAAEVIKHNPYVHNIIHQEREAIPNPTLGAYWDDWSKDYEKYINLSESIEGKLLTVEGRRDYHTHAAWRRERCNHNYIDWTMQLGGYPEIKGMRGELFFSDKEESNAEEIRQDYKNRYLILWALNGSSHHKIYGLLPPVAGEWLDSHKDAVMVTMGGDRAKPLEFEHPQVINGAVKWTIPMGN